MNPHILLARFGGHGAGGLFVLFLLMGVLVCGMLALFNSLSNSSSDSKKDTK